MFFEIPDHKLTSEATIARLGILYITDDDGYQWSGYYHFWINKIMCIIAMGNNDSLERLVSRYKYINKNRNKNFSTTLKWNLRKKNQFSSYANLNFSEKFGKYSPTVWFLN